MINKDCRSCCGWVISFATRKVVTSALPYIHGVPHLGNLVGSLLPADIYHRFLDVRGVENIYICGSDEHGTPLELAALDEDVPVGEYADRQHEKVKQILEEFDLDFSLYGRTHTDYNRRQTHQMFKQLYRNGYISEKTQNLPYCRDCARFLPDRYIEGECPHCGGLARGDQCDEQGCGRLLEPEEIVDPYCTICENRDITFRETKNLFLELPQFEEELKEWLKSDAPIPDSVKAEVLNLIEDGLEDRCITRDISWGFEVPTEEFDDLDDDIYDDKVLYVWFDAPIGYIGITRQFFDGEGDEDRWTQFWKDDTAETIYSIGKDNTIFHSIIWPSMLLGQHDGYNLPDYEFIHQYLLSEDVQFSKSRGKGLTSEKALELLPADYWRFYLAAVMPVAQDSRFSWDDFESKINGELNDTIGNYANRVLSLADKWFDGKVPERTYSGLDQESTAFFFGEDGIAELVEEYEHQAEEEKDLKKALETAIKIAHRGDEFLSEREPWNNKEIRPDVIFACLQSLEALAVCLYPYVPSASQKLWQMLSPGGELVNGQDRLAEVRRQETSLDAGHALGEREILFEKIETDELKSSIEEDDDEEDEDDSMSEISFDQFQKMDLRTATIKSVEDHPNADKLYILKIDVGGDIKQSCAGLKPHFAPEELEGRQVVVVNNLETSELRGEKSELMVLAVDSDDDVVLLQPSRSVEDGSTVR